MGLDKQASSVGPLFRPAGIGLARSLRRAAVLLCGNALGGRRVCSVGSVLIRWRRPIIRSQQRSLDNSVWYAHRMTKQTAKRPSPRERLLAASDELFYRDGVHSTGIDAIIETAGVAKGSLYYIFGGKDELVAAYLRGRLERWRQAIETCTGECRGSGREDPGGLRCDRRVCVSSGVSGLPFPQRRRRSADGGGPAVGD